MVADFEFDGAIIAMSLALVALAYGVFQSRARPAPPMSAEPLMARLVEAAPLPLEPPMAVPEVAPAVAMEAAVVTPPSSLAVNATMLNAIWKRQDSRSLQQAFTGLRSQTLAFYRCGMRMTDTNRAVATCEGASGATWTFNFRRRAGRWQIDRVTTR